MNVADLAHSTVNEMSQYPVYYRYNLACAKQHITQSDQS